MKTVLTLLILVFAGCNQLPSRYENIEGNKTRPFTVVFEPAEAAPGDTVDVRLYCFFPVGITPVIRWEAALDYGIDLYGNQILERHIIPVDAGADPLHFKFVVPDSALLYSTELKSTFELGAAGLGLTMAQADSMLDTLAALHQPLPAPITALHLVDPFASRIKFRAEIESDITLDVTRLLDGHPCGPEKGSVGP